ncbi:MAG TPA: hypothetical protein VGC10_06540 [Sphingomonas sp.]
MIDVLSLGVTHALMLLAAWRLFRRDDLDSDDLDGNKAGGDGPAAPRRAAWGRRGDA